MEVKGGNDISKEVEKQSSNPFENEQKEMAMLQQLEENEKIREQMNQEAIARMKRINEKRSRTRAINRKKNKAAREARKIERKHRKH